MADTQTSSIARRERRGAAAVIAQYIQDLAEPAEPAPCASLA